MKPRYNIYDVVWPIEIMGDKDPAKRRWRVEPPFIVGVVDVQSGVAYKPTYGGDYTPEFYEENCFASELEAEAAVERRNREIAKTK